MNLTDDSFIIYAAKHYDTKRSSSTEEFHDDLKRIQYLKRLFQRYEDDGYHEYLKTFALFLNYMPKRIEYNGEIINSDSIEIDIRITRELQKL